MCTFWLRERMRKHSKEDLGNSLKKMKHVNNNNRKVLCGPSDQFEWVFCALLSEISWHIYRPCQREKRKDKNGGREKHSSLVPTVKKYPPIPVRLLFWSHFIEIFHKKEDNFSLCFKLTPDPSHQIYLTVSSWEQWDQTWEFVSAAAVSLPDAPKGQTTKCLQAFRGLISISQKHPLLNSWQQQLC